LILQGISEESNPPTNPFREPIHGIKYSLEKSVESNTP
jgi:hypothetical protein